MPYEEDSRYLSPSSSSTPKKSPSKHNLARNRSSTSLRGGTSSLAHELAVALLPEPTAGSKLLAEEFEGDGVPTFAVSNDLDPSMSLDATPESSTPPATDDNDDNDDDAFDPTFDSLTTTAVEPRVRRRSLPDADAMSLLSQNLESTEKFLAHLRRLDTDGPAPLALETLAADIISRLNETVRDREEQVRELLKYEREFQRIGAEVGGPDALASLDALEDPRGLSLSDAHPSSSSSSSSSSAPAPASAPATASEPAHSRTLEPVAEEPSFAHDWEIDPDAHHLMNRQDDDGAESDVDVDVDGGTGLSLKEDSFVVTSPVLPPVLTGPATPATAIPHLAHLRTHTASLVSSLTALSEHAQVNGAATTEAGRKIRALKNKLGGWRMDWDSAERSRARIERWETSGDVEGGARRVDGRTVVAEHLREFERVLVEANVKTQAIMVPS
ncbi:hypothetical protein BGW80DRAFT_1437229 [Lactifluus volemus]|nr:hypothetical protein BGW80DRAFT_1437229 [Lactifluus volemus]